MVWLVLAVYAVLGLLVAVPLLLGGLRRIDAAAAAAPVRVKILWLPGLVALWPLMVLRFLGRRPREDRP
jgi:hypothetical protein